MQRRGGMGVAHEVPVRHGGVPLGEGANGRVRGRENADGRRGYEVSAARRRIWMRAAAAMSSACESIR